MARVVVKGKGTATDPWVLKTPPGTSEYKMCRDDAADPPALVCRGMGAVSQEPREGLVRFEEGSARKIRDVRSAIDRGPGQS